jgi:hypothetical protein
MSTKDTLGLIAILITFAGFYPYIRDILKGKLKPHFFSWIIWGITTLIVFFATLFDKGGAGAYAIGVSATITIGLAFLSYKKRADLSITLSDYIFLFLALSSIPLWYFSSSALLAVALLTFIDLLGFGPTFTKAYKYPKEESVLFYSIFTIRNIVVILALENYTLVTMLFPSAIAIACILLIWMIVYRRKSL